MAIPDEKQTNKFSSIILNTNKTTLELILLINFNISNNTLISITTAIHNLFKNQPIKNNPNTQQTINTQIISTYLPQTRRKKLTNSAINMGISRLKRAKVLIYEHGMYRLNPAFTGCEGINQVVIRNGSQAGK